MRSAEHSEMLREVGLVPTIQRLAILDLLCRTKQHPSADQVLAIVKKEFPSISRATVYNTLDALTKAGMILRLNVDPAVARYDADLGPHAHFRCRVCQKVYDIEVKPGRAIDVRTDGHLVESVRTYAYGVCASCRGESDQPKKPKTRSASEPSRSNQSIPKKPEVSSPGPPRESGESERTKEPAGPSSPVPPLTGREGGTQNA